MQSVLEGHKGESFPGKASLQNMVETKSLSSNPVNKKTSEGERGFLGQHCSGRAVEPPLLSPARPVAQIYWRVPGAFCGSRSCADMAAVCPGSVTVSCLSVCFRVAGATINLDFTPDFDLQKYRDRLVQGLLSQVHEPAGLGGTNETTSHWPHLPVTNAGGAVWGEHAVPATQGVQPHSPLDHRAHLPHLASWMSQLAMGAGTATLAPHHSPAAPSTWGRNSCRHADGEGCGGLAGNPGLENTGRQL